jgi:hypothetical protein
VPFWERYLWGCGNGGIKPYFCHIQWESDKLAWNNLREINQNIILFQIWIFFFLLSLGFIFRIKSKRIFFFFLVFPSNLQYVVFWFIFLKLFKTNLLYSHWKAQKYGLVRQPIKVVVTVFGMVWICTLFWCFHAS